MPGAAKRMIASCVASAPAEHAGLPALAHHQHPVRQQKQLRHLRSHNHNGQSLGGQAEYELIDLLFRSDVNAARRLVEKQDPGSGRQPLADGDLLLVAARTASPTI